MRVWVIMLLVTFAEPTSISHIIVHSWAAKKTRCKKKEEKKTLIDPREKSVGLTQHSMAPKYSLLRYSGPQQKQLKSEDFDFKISETGGIR